jgi:hypothetical protein
MANSKLDFLSRICLVKKAWRDDISHIIPRNRWMAMVESLYYYGMDDDWETVKDVMNVWIPRLPYPEDDNECPAQHLDYLYSLIPGRNSKK